MSVEPIPPELKLKAFEVFCRELGHFDAVRLFRGLGLGSGDYTKDREQFADMTEEEMDEGLRKFRADAAIRWRSERTEPSPTPT